MDPNAQNPVPGVPAATPTPISMPTPEPIATPEPQEAPVEQPVVPVIPTEGTGDAGTGMPPTTPPAV